MPKDKNFKRLVRERMAKTGESYVTARAQLLKNNTPPSNEPDFGPMFIWDVAPVVKLARDEARLRKNIAVGPSHLLLGLLDYGGAAVAALNALNVSTAAVRAHVERNLTSGRTSAPPTVHREASQVLALALEESRERGDTSVTDVALLIALASTPGVLAIHSPAMELPKNVCGDISKVTMPGPSMLNRSPRVWELLADALGGSEPREVVLEVVISDQHGRLRVDVHTSRPGVLIGRRGETADWIRGRLVDDYGPLFLNIMETRPIGSD